MTAASIADAAAGAPAPVRPASREPQFLRYLAGQTVSQLGNMVWFVALSWSAVQLGSPGVASILMILSSLPSLVLMLFGGVIADRYDVRRLMIGSDLLRTAITAAAAGVALLHPGIALLALLALSFGVVSAFFQPAAGSMQPRLLQPEQYAGAAVLSTVFARLGLSIGAPLGGLVVAWGGLPLGLAVDAATFAVSVATLATVRPRPLPADRDPQAARDYLGDFKIGFAFLFRHPVLGPLSAVAFLMDLGFVGPMNIGLAVLSQQRGWGADGVGLMLAGFGLGAAGGAVLINRIGIRRNAGIWISVSSVLQGAAVLGNALAPSIAVAVAATFAVGICSGPSNVLGSVLVQSGTPDRLRGRVSSFQTLISLGSVPLAMVGTGFALTELGPVAAYALCGAIEALALLALLSPGFRRAGIENGP